MNWISNNRKQRVTQNKRWWQGILWEARNRILLLYTSVLISFVAVSLFLFREILFTRVDARVQNYLNTEMISFLNAYKEWENSPNSSPENIGTFMNEFLDRELTDDENYLIALLDGYKKVSHNCSAFTK